MALPKPAPEDAIRHLARCLIAGTVVSAHEVPDHAFNRVFVPAVVNARALFGSYSYDDFARVTVFAIDGQHATMGKGRVAGYPQFAECQVWLIEDFGAAVDEAIRLVEEQGDAVLTGRARRRARRATARAGSWRDA